MLVHGGTAALYRDFAAYAANESRTLAEWAFRLSDDAAVLDWLERLPEHKRQPNLVFAAARWHGVQAPGPYEGLRSALLDDDAGGQILHTIETRATQTNEVGRMATLVPAFAAIPDIWDGRPVALLEVGASAGLCLYPDRWRYEWRTPGGVTRGGTGVGPLHCLVGGRAPLPARAPRVAWRGGIDLNPLELTDDDAMAWLRMLVWPEQTDRLRLLDQGIEVARSDPPEVVRGDMIELLPHLIEYAAAQGPVIVFHTAVAAYLDVDQRKVFHELMTGLVAEGACHWVSNEGKDVLPDVTVTGPAVPDELATFVMGIDGRAVAWTHGHGRSLTWL